MRYFLCSCVLLLASCASPSGVQAIVGARLIRGPGSSPIDFSVIVIENGKFKAVGPQASVPVPKGAEITRGLGMTAAPIPGGFSIEVGNPANLVLETTDLGPVVRTMRDGNWVR